MENLEDAAKEAAARWNARKDAKAEIRQLVLELKQNGKTMTDIAIIVGVSRTSLYYFLYGRDGKTKSARRTNDVDLPISDGTQQLRKSA
jgi:DNA invertase Pin-like site-specific DNA recombinase